MENLARMGVLYINALADIGSKARTEAQ